MDFWGIAGNKLRVDQYEEGKVLWLDYSLSVLKLKYSCHCGGDVSLGLEEVIGENTVVHTTGNTLCP